MFMIFFKISYDNFQLKTKGQIRIRVTNSYPDP